jgi:hypothetical protein
MKKQKSTIDEQLSSLDELSWRADRTIRRNRAILWSDIDELKGNLRAAAQRFLDLADIIEQNPTYDAVSFLRTSGRRYMWLAENCMKHDDQVTAP